MCNASPAKIFRNVRRITKFNEKKASQNISPVKAKPSLSIEILPHNDFPPKNKIISFLTPTLVSCSPIPRQLSIGSQLPFEIVPGLFDEDQETISTYIEGTTRQTTFVCNICYSDHFRSTQSIKKHRLEVHKIFTQPNVNNPFEARFELLSI